MLIILLIPITRGSWEKFVGDFNQLNLRRTVGLQAIVAIGELLVILTGGIDLSVGSLSAFGGMLLAVVGTRLADAGMPVGNATLVAVFAVLGFAALLGLIHALLIHFLRLPPFVVTLASMSILQSGAKLLNNSVPVPIEKLNLVTMLGNGSLPMGPGPKDDLPIPTVIMLLIALAIGAILVGSRTGRHVYSVGSNVEASRLSGVSILKVRMFTYMTCSMLAGLAAILNAGYGGQGDPQAGQMLELNAISAAVIGGAVLTGGRGSVLGTVLGTTLLEEILNIINLTIESASMWRGVVVGGVLLTAVVLNQIRLFLAARSRRGAGSG